MPNSLVSNTNPLEALRLLAADLATEGKKTRAERVTELVDNVERLLGNREPIAWFRWIKTKGDGIEHPAGTHKEKKFETNKSIVSMTPVSWHPVCLAV